jgi:hypothetical protein
MQESGSGVLGWGVSGYHLSRQRADKETPIPIQNAGVEEVISFLCYPLFSWYAQGLQFV